MTGRQFDAILKELGLTRPSAAKAIGISMRSVTSYANRKGAVPRWLELAVRGCSRNVRRKRTSGSSY